jgi:hypothetical protein
MSKFSETDALCDVSITPEKDVTKISNAELEARHIGLLEYIEKFTEIFGGSAYVPSEWKQWLSELETEMLERALRKS